MKRSLRPSVYSARLLQTVRRAERLPVGDDGKDERTYRPSDSILKR
jgi:hypothetical protein